MNDVFQTLVNAIVEVCGIDPSDITEDKHIIDDLGVDSIDFLDITYELDKKYNIKIPVDNWVALINENVARSEDYFVVKSFIDQVGRLIKEASK